MMNRATVLVAIPLLCAGCGGASKTDEDGTVDTQTDTGTDPTGDAGDDTGADAADDPAPDEADDPEEVDTGEDPPPDVEEDGEPCIPGDVGEPASDELLACVKALSCAPVPGMDVDPGEFCVYVDAFLAGPIWFSGIDDVMGMHQILMLFAKVDDQEVCVAGAEGCEEVFACLNDDVAAECTMAVSDAWAWGDSCDGDVLTVCQGTEIGTSDGLEYLHDCSDDGLECVEITGYGAWCMETGCDAAGDPECDGDEISYCLTDGAHVVYDCDALTDGQGTCGDVDPDTLELDAGCVPVTDECDPLTVDPHCEGDVLVECDGALGHWVEIDCSDVDEEWSCDDDSGVADCEPDPASWECTLPLEPACDCDDLVFCHPIEGVDVRVHCPDLGATTCGDQDPSTIELEAGCID